MLKRKYSSSREHKNRGRVFLRIFLLLVLFTACIYFFSIRPTILSLLEYHGKIYVSQALTQSVNEVLADKKLSYDNFVSISNDENGNITSVKTSGETINEFKNTVMSKITDKLFGDKQMDIQIPIGTLTGIELFSGKGPCFPMKISSTGYANTDIISVFETAGINQTNHILKLKVKIDYTTLIPVYSKRESFESDYVIAQMLIVGKIPQYYSQSPNESGYLVPKVN